MPYSVRVWVCTVLLALSLVTVGYGGSTGVQLLGVCFSSVQAGLGEASFLALASFYDTPRALTAWSSGTGFAGIFGYAWVFLLKFAFGFSFRATLMMANLLGFFLLYAYFGLLSSPHKPSSGNSDSAGEGGSLQTKGGGGVAGSAAYSPLRPSRQRRNNASTDDGGRGGRSYSSKGSREEGGEERWELGEGGGGGALDVETAVAVESPREMTVGDRLRFTLSLWRFTVPLMLVYFAEVRENQGLSGKMWYVFCFFGCPSRACLRHAHQALSPCFVLGTCSHAACARSPTLKFLSPSFLLMFLHPLEQPDCC